MRISTEIIRHPFGVSAEALAADKHGSGTSFAKDAKATALERHKEAVKLYTDDSRFLALSSGYDEKNDGAIAAEWWTVVVLDLDR